jgi:hypothetical protein
MSRYQKLTLLIGILVLILLFILVAVVISRPSPTAVIPATNTVTETATLIDVLRTAQAAGQQTANIQLATLGVATLPPP